MVTDFVFAYGPVVAFDALISNGPSIVHTGRVTTQVVTASEASRPVIERRATGRIVAFEGSLVHSFRSSSLYRLRAECNMVLAVRVVSGRCGVAET